MHNLYLSNNKGFVLLLVLVLLTISSFILIDGLQLAKTMQFVANTNYHALQQRNLSKSLMLKAIAQLQGNTDEFIPSLLTDLHDLLGNKNQAIIYCFDQGIFLQNACRSASIYLQHTLSVKLKIEYVEFIGNQYIIF